MYYHKILNTFKLKKEINESFWGTLEDKNTEKIYRHLTHEISWNKNDSTKGS